MGQNRRTFCLETHVSLMVKNLVGYINSLPYFKDYGKGLEENSLLGKETYKSLSLDGLFCMKKTVSVKDETAKDSCTQPLGFTLPRV